MTSTKNPAFIIDVASIKGGVGKSTIARLIATELTRDGHQVLLADMDHQNATSRDWANLRIDRDILPLVEVRVLSGPAAIEKLKPDYDFIVIDSLPYSKQANAKLTAISDLVVVPTGPRIDDLCLTAVFAKSLPKMSGKKDIPYRIVIMKTQTKPQTFAARIYLDNFADEGRVLHTAIREKPSHGLALDRGGALTETSWTGPREDAEKVMGEIVSAVDALKADQTPSPMKEEPAKAEEIAAEPVKPVKRKRRKVAAPNRRGGMVSITNAGNAALKSVSRRRRKASEATKSTRATPIAA